MQPNSSARQPEGSARARPPVIAGLFAVLCLTALPAVLPNARAAAADAPIASPAAVIAKDGCLGIDAKLARQRADVAFQHSRYRLAGQCYLIAGDDAKANLSFVKAAAAESVTTKRQLVANASQAKDQFRQWREAFTSR